MIERGRSVRRVKSERFGCRRRFVSRRYATETLAPFIGVAVGEPGPIAEVLAEFFGVEARGGVTRDARAPIC
jgi:hypothetical protein